MEGNISHFVTQLASSGTNSKSMQVQSCSCSGFKKQCELQAVLSENKDTLIYITTGIKCKGGVFKETFSDLVLPFHKVQGLMRVLSKKEIKTEQQR